MRYMISRECILKGFNLKFTLIMSRGYELLVVSEVHKASAVPFAAIFTMNIFIRGGGER